jgi:ATP-dependent RNA helicase DDX24/MAK5
MKSQDSQSIKRQTLVFSATMIKDASIQKQFRKQKAKSDPFGSKGLILEELLKRIDFRSAKPVYVNLVKEKITAEGIKESKIECLKTEKAE